MRRDQDNGTTRHGAPAINPQLQPLQSNPWACGAGKRVATARILALGEMPVGPVCSLASRRAGASIVQSSFDARAPFVKTKVLYLRIDRTKHRLLSELAASWEVSLSTVTEQLIDQLLFQTFADFEAPSWLLQAVHDGLLPIKRHCETREAGVDNIVKLAGHR